MVRTGRVLPAAVALGGHRRVCRRHGGVFNRLSADWAATDQVHAILGYDFFHAKRGMFARYARNSEIWIKLKYSF